MPYITPAMLSKVEEEPEHVRNVCILAHVDHGKTTLSDSLIATNQIISSRLAGEVRYMDSTPEEQARGITMKSSAISLLHGYVAPISGEEGKAKAVPHVINLIDSPGHLDFAQEVSSAVRTCDGALVLVDVLEGVSKQTHGVLEQAWKEQLAPVLVFNKLDRLILELGMDPGEAYGHICMLLEQVNVIMATLYVSDILQRYTEAEERDGEGNEEGDDAGLWDEGDDEDLYFSPEKGNVLFGSAIDGWAFSIQDFIDIYAKKIGASRRVLGKTLWGPYFFHPKKGKILKNDDKRGRLNPMFVTFVLDPIWAVYTSTVIAPDADKVAKIISKLDLKIPPRVLRQKDRRLVARAIMAKWLPIAPAVLDKVVSVLPSPVVAQKTRFAALLPPLAALEAAASAAADAGDTGDAGDASFAPFVDPLYAQGVQACDASAPLLAFVSKMVAVPRDQLPEKPRSESDLAHQAELRAKARAREKSMREGELVDAVVEDVDPGVPIDDVGESSSMVEEEEVPEEEEEEDKDGDVFVAFTRVFSGSLRKGMTIQVLGPKFDPREPEAHVGEVEIQELYLMMGRSLEATDVVPAGSVCGIGGLEDVVFNTATLAASREVPSFTAMQQQVAPIVRVAVEPRNPIHMREVKAGLRILNQADPCAQVLVQANGETVLLAAGELHLQKCLKDLRERFAKVPIWSSDPIVPYRETVVGLPVAVANEDEMSPLLAKRIAELEAAAVAGVPHPIFLGSEEGGGVASSSSSAGGEEDVDTTAVGALGRGILGMRKARQLVESFGGAEKVLGGSKFLLGASAPVVAATSADRTWGVFLAAAPLPDALVRGLVGLKEEIKSVVALASSGETAGRIQDLVRPLFEEAGWGDRVDSVISLGPSRIGGNVLLNGLSGPGCEEDTGERDALLTSIVTGFQLATSSGPLCAEPMLGVCFEVVGLVKLGDGGEDESSYGPLSGQLITATKRAASEAFLAQSPRVMEAMYRCEIQANADSLGRLYALLFKRRARVLNETMKEGTPYFIIESLIPVAESFGLADRIQRSSSGVAAPQLAFASFETNTLDPFWIPSTEEEIEEFGSSTNEPNLVFGLMNGVRRRKGLEVFEKLVEHADKQRTFKRNK